MCSSVEKAFNWYKNLYTIYILLQKRLFKGLIYYILLAFYSFLYFISYLESTYKEMGGG